MKTPNEQPEDRVKVYIHCTNCNIEGYIEMERERAWAKLWACPCCHTRDFLKTPKGDSK